MFPDDEALIQAEFERTLAVPPRAGAGRRSDPANPDSPVGIDVEPFYLDQDDIDPQNGQQSLFDFKFAVSYGDPQEVRVLAKRSLGAVTLHYQINGGRGAAASTSEWNGGERYGPGNGVYYHVVRGDGDRHRRRATASRCGSRAAARRATRSPTRVESDSGRRVLIVAAEDYTGASPAMPGATAPEYLSFYTDALTANGVAFDVYDVDAHGRTAPDNLGVLSHYDAVVWYTGDDVVTREPGWGPGNASRLAMQEMLEVRDFVNEGGRVLYTGQRAGQQYTTGARHAAVRPVRERAVQRRPGRPGALPGAVGVGQLAGRPDRVHVRRGDHHGGRRDSIRTPAIRSTSPASTTRSPA